ncbi:MAG: SMEK domain-containing protein [Blautia massiliensis (ex Durand et al. 2017)]|uniref:SMEK domain-containing protein n=1 Tax=Blautia massiliensis (ex Durand et al. 2017) TaxID=1737424 RepID=UPI00399CF00F
MSILNAVNLYDINIIAEDFFPGLLNLIYGYELKNANHLEKNAPAIDLIDRKNRIAVQVTSDNSSTKIRHTIAEFNKNQAYHLYDRLVATVYKGNIIKNLIMDCQSYTKYRPNETTGGIFVSWRRKEELPTGA